jgi:hypothetical protein
VAEASGLGTPGQPALVATASDAARVGMGEGVYALGTGSSGATQLAVTSEW